MTLDYDTKWAKKTTVHKNSDYWDQTEFKCANTSFLLQFSINNLRLENSENSKQQQRSWHDLTNFQVLSWFGTTSLAETVCVEQVTPNLSSPRTEKKTVFDSVAKKISLVYIAVDMNNEEADDDYSQWVPPWCRLQMSDWPEWWMTGVTIITNLRFNSSTVASNIVVVLAATHLTTNIKTSIGDVMEILIWATIRTTTYNKTRLLGTTITSTNIITSTKTNGQIHHRRKTIHLPLLLQWLQLPHHGPIPVHRQCRLQILLKVQVMSNTIHHIQHHQLQPDQWFRRGQQVKKNKRGLSSGARWLFLGQWRSILGWRYLFGPI